MRGRSTLRPVPDARRTLALLALWAACALSALPAEAAIPRPRYEAEVRWDADTGLFEVSQVIHWTNPSSRPLDELRLLHPWAALAATEGPWWRSARELGLALPNEGDAPEVSARVLEGTLEDAHEPGSGTYALSLAEDLEPGASISLRVETSARLETIVGRVGRHGDFLAAAGWLVRVAPFNPQLHARGEPPWSDEAAHALVETQIEHFDAAWSATLPARYAGKLAATGTLVEERVEGALVRARWEAPQVVELALFADPRFVVRDARDVDYMRLRGGPQPRVFLQPEHRDLGALMLSETFWQARELAPLGGRSLQSVAVVDPPLGARGVSGMEYPGVVTVRPRPTRQGLSIETLRLLRHELAHQVFYAEIASDTVQETFLEEGLVTLWEMLPPEHHQYIGQAWRGEVAEFLPDPASEDRSPLARIVRAWYLGAGPRSLLRQAVEAAPMSWRRLQIDGRESQRLRWVSRAGRGIVRRPGATHESRGDLLAHAYALSALTIEQALRDHGLDTREVLRALAERFRGQRMSADDFLAFLDDYEESGAGGTLAGYWESAGFVDAALVELSCDEGGSGPVCHVLFQHEGPWKPGLVVWLDFDDTFETETRAWPPGRERFRVQTAPGRRVVAAGVGYTPLDVDSSNDARLLKAHARSGQRAWLHAWRQLILRLSGLGRLP